AKMGEIKSPAPGPWRDLPMGKDLPASLRDGWWSRGIAPGPGLLRTGRAGAFGVSSRDAPAPTTRQQPLPPPPPARYKTSPTQPARVEPAGLRQLYVAKIKPYHY